MLPVGQGCVKVHLFKKTFVKFYWLPTLFMALIEYQYSKRIEPILEQLSNGFMIYSNAGILLWYANMIFRAKKLYTNMISWGFLFTRAVCRVDFVKGISNYNSRTN